MKNKIIVFFSIIIVIFSLNYKVFAKYITTNEFEEVIRINKLNIDTLKPDVNGRREDYDHDEFTKDVNVTYSDESGISSAKYWFNPDEKNFSRCTEKISTVEQLLAKIGWYQVLVTDSYGNQNRYVFLIDKIFDEISVSAPEANDSGTTFTINAKDKLSGISKIEFYINGKLYKTFDYTNQKLNNKTEIITVPIKDIPFYENCYVKGIDFKQNTKNSSEITPNISRINDLTDLLKLRKLHNERIVNFDSRDLYLLNNINLSGNWTPIGTSQNQFKGRFHGNNHSISNLQIVAGSDCQGIFGVNGGEISNLLVYGNISAGGYSKMGGIAGENTNTITNCKSHVTINGTGTYYGGITGANSKGYVTNCLNYESISGKESIGGICGASSGYVENCGNRSSSSITASFQSSGGIIGYAEVQLDGKDCALFSCYNNGTIKASRAVGGIVGGSWNVYNKNVTIKCCYNTGTITSNENLNGGILGGTQHYFDGSNSDSTKNIVKDCYNIGQINCSSQNQISCIGAIVQNSYYIFGRANASFLGTYKIDILFKSFNSDSVFMLLNNSLPIWTINSLNNGYPCFLWQNE